ncbi:MAG: hypothetical protein KDA91_23760 [Planctomycetaceae bacterium]|nr:hypothetical protein [Planctomycetaceae bacterium]
MGSQDGKSSEGMDTKVLVRTAAETILMLRDAEQLMGGRLGVEGLERAMLVSAMRSKVGDGLGEPTLHALADFVPMAFVRIALSDSGVSLPDHFGRKDSRNRIREYRRLDEELIYREAVTLAQMWWQSRADDVRYVARWNGALALVENALARGAKGSDLEFAPTLLNGPDDVCPPLAKRPTFPERPWWLSQWMPKPWWKFW